MKSDSEANAATYTTPYFHITPEGFAAVKGFGVTARRRWRTA